MWELKLTSVVAMTMRKACRGKEFKFAKDKTRGGGRIYVNWPHIVVVVLLSQCLWRADYPVERNVYPISVDRPLQSMMQLPINKCFPDFTFYLS